MSTPSCQWCGQSLVGVAPGFAQVCKHDDHAQCKPVPEIRPRLPAWTIGYNLSPEVLRTYWVGKGWEFYDDEKQAKQRYDALIAQGHCPFLRPYYPTDSEHLGAVHQEQEAYRHKFLAFLESYKTSSKSVTLDSNKLLERVRTEVQNRRDMISKNKRPEHVEIEVTNFDHAIINTLQDLFPEAF